ncbi:MAG: hypothetical protein ABIT07_06885, partial [Ferruginibacter sp.]
SFATNAAIMNAIEGIKNYAGKQLAGSPATEKGYFLLTLERIKNRVSGKAFVPVTLPPGSPIGCDMD